MTAIKLLSKNKYLKVPLFYSGTGGNVPPWRQHLQPCEWIGTTGEQDILFSEIGFENTSIKIDAKFVNVRGYGGWNDSNNNWYGINNGKFAVGNFDIDFDNFIEIYLNYIINKQVIANYNNSTYLGGFFYNNGSFNGLHLFNLDNLNGLTSFTKNIQIATLSNNYNLIAAYVIDEYEDNKGNLCTAGVTGMVNIGTGIFYTNDGTGNFLHGEDIEI